MTDLNEYQRGTLKTWDGTERPIRSILGTVGESGEVAECYKKYLRGDYGHETFKARIKGELGDVLYYVAVCAYEHGFQLSDIANYNYEKLQKRLADNTIKGDGEDREGVCYSGQCAHGVPISRHCMQCGAKHE